MLVAEVADGTMFALGIMVAVVVYLIPSFVAANKEHPNQGAIVALNILTGWSFIGWVIALVWACTESKPDNSEELREILIAKASKEKSSVEERLQKLANLNVKGVISAQEYEKQKQRILNDL